MHPTANSVALIRKTYMLIQLYVRRVMPGVGRLSLGKVCKFEGLNMKIKIIILMLAFFLMFVSASNAQTTTVSAADSTAIKQTALDYIEGWYEGNAERMERALHPELAKRMVRTSPQGKSHLDQMSAMTLVQYTRAGGGKSVPKDKQQKDVTILDVFENAASVKVVASDWVDYMQMAKFDGRWVIVNVLWELKPKAK